MKVKKNVNGCIVEELIGNSGNSYSSSKFLLNSIKSLSEAVDFEVDDNQKGGVIVFSTDVNAIPQSSNKIVNWIKQKAMTLNNRINSAKKIDKISQEHNLVGWTIGKALNGRYTAKNGTPFGENSLSVEIVGVDSNTLIDIATQLCKEFDQESVLVKDYTNNKIYFVNSN